MNRATKEEMIQEAEKRLAELQNEARLMPGVLEQFKESRKISYSGFASKYETLYGVYNLKDSNKIAKLVKAYEKQNDVVVYHCIVGGKSSKNLLYILYVNEQKDMWYLDNLLFTIRIVFSKVINTRNSSKSRYEYIEVKGVDGGAYKIEYVD